MLQALLEALQETILMVLTASLTALAIGLPLGCLLFISQAGSFWPRRWLNRPLAFLIHLSHSVPYVMIMLAVIPIIKPIWGQHNHLLTAIIPLTLAAIPAFARNVQTALSAVPTNLIETALSFGASPAQIFRHILALEALPSFIQSTTDAMIHLVGYSTIAGALTGGGLSGLAIQKGYYALEPYYILASLLLLVSLIHGIRAVGQFAALGHWRSLQPKALNLK